MSAPVKSGSLRFVAFQEVLDVMRDVRGGANIGYADGHVKPVTKQPSGIKGIGLLSDTKWQP